MNLNTLKYFFSRYCLQKDFMIAPMPESYYSIKLKFKTEDCVGRHMYKKGSYDENCTNFLLKYLDFSKPLTIFDIGANIGWYSVLFAKAAKGGAKIFAFEPDDLNFELLSNNIASNHCEGVTLVKKGLGDQIETKKLYLYPSKNLGRHSMIADPNLKSIDVEVTTLDEYCQANDVSHIDFLKIDIEGFEYYAFKGGKKMLENTSALMMEYGPGFYDGGENTKANVLGLLYDLGFQAYFIENEGIEKTDRETLLAQDKHVNLFWQKG